MGITIKELSEITGYSTATISRVIAKKGNVKESTRKEIEKVLWEYNYRTNIMDLRESIVNKHTIMVIMGDVKNWYYMEIFKVINKIARENNFITVIS